MLRRICGFRATLPASYQVSEALSFTSQVPIAFGGFCDAYKGTLAPGTAVCIKRIRVSATDDKEKLKQVRHSSTFNVRPEPHWLTGFAVVLQGGCGVETPQPPPHRTLHRRHARAPSACVRMDARGRVEKLYQRESTHRPDQPCKSTSAHLGCGLTLLSVAWRRWRSCIPPLVQCDTRGS